MGKILVTGSNGVVGRVVAQALVDGGHQVLGVSLEDSGFAVSGQMEYKKLDICEGEALSRLFDDNVFDVVIHLAALVHVRRRALSFVDYCHVNFRASERVFRLASERGVRRIVFASTVEVYGPTPVNHVVGEDASCHPESDYARSKLLAEQALKQTGENSRLSYAVMRLAPVYGANFRLNINKRIYLRPPFGYRLSNGEYQLSLCSAHNVAHFISRWLELQDPASGIFNVADRDMYSVKLLLDIEARARRCKVIFRIPYSLALVGTAAVEAAMNLAGNAPLTLNAGNLRKLVRSARWATLRVESIVGPLPFTIHNTPGFV